MYVLVYVLECIRQLRFSQGRMFIKVKEHIHCAYMKYKRKMTNIRMQRRHKKVKQHTCVEWVHWTLTSARLVGCALRLLLLDCFASSQATAFPTLKCLIHCQQKLHLICMWLLHIPLYSFPLLCWVCDTNVLEFGWVLWLSLCCVTGSWEVRGWVFQSGGCQN